MATRRSRERGSARSGRRRSTRPASACAAGRVPRRRPWLAGRRRRADHPRRRRGARDAAGAGDRAHGAERADGQAGPPMEGKDLHIGDFEWGILPATAPLSISTLTIAGIAMAFARERSDAWRCRSSARAGRRSASGTRRSICAPRAGCRRCSASRTTRPRCRRRSASSLPSRVFADKAAGYGMPGFTIDGTDADAIAAAFTWAADRARAGAGPDAHRARLHAHVRPRASRRHAVSRPGAARSPGSIPSWRRKAPTPIAGAVRVLGEASDPIAALRRAARGAKA